MGAQAYLGTDPCSADYEPWVGLDGDTLLVKVVGVPRPRAPGGGIGLLPSPSASPIVSVCIAVGYGHLYHIRLPEPFTGTVVRDLNGGSFYLAAPPNAVEASVLPAGWTFQYSYTQEPGPPPIWVQVYGPPGLQRSRPVEGPERLVLYQAFGEIGEWSDTRAIKAEARGAKAIEVTLNGKPATVWRDGASGELLLAWTLDGISIGLVGNTADLSVTEFVRIANGVRASS